MMRIGIVAPPWAPVPPEAYGGIERVVNDLAVALKRAKHDVLLFTTGDATCPVARRCLLAKAEGMRIGESLPELRHVLRAYEVMVDHGVEVVHDHTLAGALHARSFPDLPVVTTIHGPLEGELADFYRAAGDAVALVAISHDQRQAAPDVDVARVIHHGLDARDVPVGRGNGGYCLFLGRMSPDKGAHRAIEVAKRAGIPLALAGKIRHPSEVEYFRTEA
jgi:glycosyltransferase involved in cell wall biosynthesis